MQTSSQNFSQPDRLERSLQSQKYLYELHTGKTKSIINYQRSYVFYLIIILSILVLLYVLYEVKKITRMRKLKHQFQSLIEFIDGIKYHMVPPSICYEAHRYTKTDGLTLVYYYQYPHSFGNPFRNINFAPAVVMCYYSQITNGSGSGDKDVPGCFSQWGDYVGLMLTYSELNIRADAADIICHSGWTTDSCAAPTGGDCPNFCCVLIQCEQFCRPFYEESIADIISNATLNAAGAGIIVGGTIKGGSMAYGKIFPKEIAEQPAFEDPEWALGATEQLGKVSQMTVEDATRVSQDASELAAQTAESLEVAAPLAETTAEGAGAVAGEAGVATGEVAVEAGTDTVATGALMGAESVGGAFDATAIGAPIGIAIGVAAAIGFGIWMGLSGRKKRKDQCQQYQQYCIPTDASGEC